MGQWTRVENSNEVFLRVTNHTGQAEKNLLGPAGIRTRDLRFTRHHLTNFYVMFKTWQQSPMVKYRTSKPKVAGSNSQPGQVDFSLLVRYGSSCKTFAKRRFTKVENLSGILCSKRFERSWVHLLYSLEGLIMDFRV